MKWHLQVSVDQKSSFHKLSHKDFLVSIGSCFSEHMGSALKDRGWRVAGNPFGILYNPFSILAALDMIISGRQYKKEDLLEYEGRYLSLDHHGSFSHADPEVVLQRINSSLDNARDYLAKASTLIITFGTAYYFSWKEDGRVVGNNHKIPATQFVRHRASISAIKETYSSLVDRLRQFNDSLQVIFTISPVRHWKNGAADDHWSKSILTCAVRELVEHEEDLHYFPSFEILMDELRDHRFYEADLLHPNQQAVDYIWSAFSNACIDEESQKTGDEVIKIRRRLEHRILDDSDPRAAQFKADTRALVSSLKVRYPYLEL